MGGGRILSLDEALPEADVVVWVASMPRTLEIDADRLQKPCLMIDGGYPKNLDSRVAGEGGVHVLKGGIVEFGSDIGWTMMENAAWQMEKPQRQMFACFAEAILLEFEACHTNFSWGRNNITLEKMDFIGAASVRHGFSDSQPSGAASGCRCLTFTDPVFMARRPLLEFEKPLIELEQQIEQIRQLARDSEVDVSQQLLQLETLAARRREEIFQNLTPAQKIQVARHPHRPSTLDFIQMFCDDWVELHGDRRGSDDQALVGGLGRLGERSVVLLGHQKGRDTKENVARNFGMATPGGYRKALRLMEHADRFGLPILAFIDTPGAYAGLLAEEQGQGEAIAVNLREMFRLRVPIIATVIGEGGSGGALGIGVADRLLMFEHSVYTVASPEACASILWRDAAKAPEAAAALRITGKDLLSLGVVDEVLSEPSGGNNWAPLEAGATLREALERNLSELLALPPKNCGISATESFGRWAASLIRTRRMPIQLLRIDVIAEARCPLY